MFRAALLRVVKRFCNWLVDRKSIEQSEAHSESGRFLILLYFRHFDGLSPGWLGLG